MAAFDVHETLTKRELKRCKTNFEPTLSTMEKHGHSPLAWVFKGEVNGLGFLFPDLPQPSPYQALGDFNAICDDASEKMRLAKYLIATGRVRGQ